MFSSLGSDLSTFEPYTPGVEMGGRDTTRRRHAESKLVVCCLKEVGPETHPWRMGIRPKYRLVSGSNG